MTHKLSVRTNNPHRSLPAILAVFLASALASGTMAFAQDKVPTVTGIPRVDKLLSQMTLDEKMALIRGASEPPATNQGQAGYLTGVPRLGIPPLRMSDGPPGVLTRFPSQAETATMGLAATFSIEDAKLNGEVVAREAKSLGIDVVLEPFINIDRDITFARGYNTYGEDPVLSGLIGANFIRGVQGQGVMSQAKHYVAYDTDGSNVYVDQQALHEIYVAPFIDAVQADVSSIMCSYNKVNGVPACGNSDTLVKILRDEVGFKGFLTSDWGAVHAANFINNGLDMEMPGPGPKDSPLGSMIFSFFTTEKPDNAPPPKPNTAMLAGFLGNYLPEEPKPKPFDFGAFGTSKDAHTNFWNLRQEGKLDDATITCAAGRVLYEMDKFGYLDHPTPGQSGPKNPPEHATEANADTIRKTAEDAAVLLKNEGHILPLKAADSVALIGPGAGQTVAIGTAGERSIGWPWRQVGTVEAIQKIDPSVHVTYAVEDDMTGSPIPASLWTGKEGKLGLQRTPKAGAKSTDPILDFTTKAGTALPADSEITWNGTLKIPTTGSYWIYLQLLGAAGNLEIDGKHIAGANGMKGGVHGDTVLGGKDGLMPTTDGLDNLRTAVELTAGKHTVTVSITGDTSGNPAQVRLAWVTPGERKHNHEAAIAAAKSAKTAVIFAWSRGKTDFTLPGNGDYDQNKLIEEIAAVNPNTIVVLNVSQPIAMPWLSKVKGVLQMWWPGDEGGWATANILLGKTSPAGRLPFTWARKLTDYPATDPAHPERSSKGVNGKTTFSEGINVGYRWFDLKKITPEFPFGFGLSYTTFAYANLKTEPAAEGGIVVEFDVKNTGSVASDEVPQVYLGRPEHKFPGEFPEHALVAFDRIHLNPGESKRVRIVVPLHRLQFWSTETGKWTTATGPRAVLVGSSSRSLDLASSIEIP